MIRDSVVLMFHLFNAFGLGSQSPGGVPTSFYIVQCLVSSQILLSLLFVDLTTGHWCCLNG